MIKSSLDSFEEAVGGRDALVDALENISLDQKQGFFLQILSDPSRSRDSLAKIARDAGLQPHSIIALFRDASFARAHAIAMGKLSERLPAVVQDVADKSVDMDVPCPDCRGIAPEKCKNCNGRGIVFRESDLDRQRIVLEASGVLKKGGGINIQMNQAVGISSPTGLFSKFVKSSDDAAYDVEGEVVK